MSEFLSYFILYCVLYVDHFYIALFSALQQTHRTLAACDSKRMTSFLLHTLNIRPSVGRPNASWSSCGVLCDFKIKAKFLFLSIKYWKRHECGLCCMLVHYFKFERCVTFLSRDMNQWMWLRALFCNTGLCAVSDVQINLGWWHRELNTSVALCSLCWDGAAKL